ncbi:tetratricopeptide repeat protein [Oceanithermus desulfurans]|uniref:Tetratricopeptide (TPR) repeat protein n=1 Tax=Oceanithermus desulfurans TaxID=227924 RepID=A0ABR6P2K1_9DEIN|nr:tetratricopeptide repeat protein [Oceanithermus desulfurans]MBB6030224.1 tetratricopeptide (TPR) repeat protein [Oceanithermus desulfurans]
MNPRELAKAFPRVLVGALLNKAEQWLGEDALAALDVAISSPDGSFLEGLSGWLRADDAERKLRAVARQAEVYVRGQCKDDELQQVFSLGFAGLPQVQDALTELPQRMGTEAIRHELAAAVARDFPRLEKAQVIKASECYAQALEYALLTHKDLALLVIGRAVFQIRAQQSEEFARVNEKLDEVLKLLGQGQVPSEAALAVFRQALVNNRLLIDGDVENSMVIVGNNNVVQLSGQLLSELRKRVTLPGDLPLGSYLPLARNTIFTGREKELAELARALLEEGENAVVQQAVAGMGGVGKTQLAVEFAYRYGYRLAGVHWLDLSDPEQLDEQIARNGLEMRLDPWPDKQPEQVSATLHAWRADGPRLLILDNYEDPDNANMVLGRLHGAELRLLITTRSRNWHAGLGLKTLALDEFSPAESLAFLRRWLPEARARDDELAELAERLGHLPLALELAGRYLHRLKTKAVSEYLSELECALEHRSMKGWKPGLGNPTGHDLSLAQTFSLSWQRLESEVARRVLLAAGYCAPGEPLPLEALEGVGGSADALQEALADLLGLGLLKEGEPPTIHPLVAEFARGLDEEGEVLADFAAKIADLANRLNSEADRAGNYALFAPLISHVRAVARAVEKRKIEDERVIAAAAQLWNSLGYHLNAVAEYKGAKAAYERALEILEDHLGEDHPNVATLVNNLGSVLKALGDLQGAKAAFERALEIFVTFLPPDHPHIKIVRNNLRSLGNSGAK